MSDYQHIDGGVTSPSGFRASGVAAGLKKEGLDLALLVSDVPAAVAGVFTTNRVKASPVRLCQAHLEDGCGRAVVVNSGCANACTGPAGDAAAESMAQATADELNISAGDVFVCSTGTIGKPLDVNAIKTALPDAVAALSEQSDAAARAIMTTDTRPKQTAVEVMIDNVPVRVGGMAKGAGMIEPNMATMLAFVTTDAAVEHAALQTCLETAVKPSFNCISVDGDQSTNDTVLLLANGAAGNTPLNVQHSSWARFCEAVLVVCRTLALAIVDDGEGATKRVTVSVEGAASDADADRVARAVANSLLVKTAWFGSDPNWGRIIAAVGYAGADVDPDQIDIDYEDMPVVRDGGVAPGFELSALESICSSPAFCVTIRLHRGTGCAEILTCDCSHEYVSINADYMT